MKRLRLSLGPRQQETLLWALSLAIDVHQPSDDDSEPSRQESQTLRDLRRLQEAVRRERARQPRHPS